MTETMKIARACFIGGALCSGVALLVAPALLWLGMIAGAAGGYVAYEFRAMLQAIPRAFRTARAAAKKVSGFFFEVGESAYVLTVERLLVFKEWLKEPHPFFYPGFGLGVALFITLFSTARWSEMFLREETIYGALVDVLIIVLAISMMSALIIFSTSMLLWALAFLGARYTENAYWHGEVTIPSEQEEWYGLHQMPMTYANAYRWIGKLLWFGLVKVFITFPIKVVRVALEFVVAGIFGFYRLLMMTPRFVYELVKLVHSDQRLLCSIAGTVGGLVAIVGFRVFGPQAPSIVEYLMVPVFGGFIGAALGIASWELVSKRVFGFGMPSG